MKKNSEESPRSKVQARSVLRKLLAERRPDIDQLEVRELLTSDFVDGLLEMVWARQFDDDRTAFKAYVQSLVDDAIENQLLETDA